MTRSMRRAFTMVELMIVIAIIGILIGLLMPVIGSATSVAQATQCQTNLSALYKAQANWNADRDVTETSVNAGWAGSLKTYLEGRVDTLRCPASFLLSMGEGASGGSGGGGSGGGADEGSTGTEQVSAEEPDIQLQDVTIGVLDKDKNLLYEIPLAPSPYWSWFQSWTLPDGRTHIGANLDNYFPKDSLGRYTDEDFYFTVEFRGSSPVKVQIGPCDGSANTGHGKWSDFRINHKAIWDGQVFGNLFAAGHVGETVDVQKELTKAAGGKEKTRRRAAYATWTVMSTSKAILGATSYGLNRGSYQALDDVDPRGYRDVPRMDPKLIFILDYPKAIADMTDIGDTMGEKTFFDYIFIDPLPPPDPPAEGTLPWLPPPGLEGRTWQETQALRHFGKANVLFCDGHIEMMEKEDLNLYKYAGLGPKLWNYQGK